MGYLFQNITQLAGFFTDQAGKSSRIKPDKQPAQFSFESFIESFSKTSNEKVDQTLIAAKPEENIEYVEKTLINEDFLKALLAKQVSNIVLELSSNEISQFLDDLSFPAFKTINKTGLAQVCNESELVSTGSFKPESSSCQLSFDVSDLINQNALPVKIIDSQGQETTKMVDVSKLIQLIQEYPEPIQTEIEIIPESFKTARNDQIISSLKSKSLLDSE